MTAGSALAAVLAKRTAFVIGVGATGTAAAARLAGAGFGRVCVVDGGQIERSDLGRSPLFFTPDIGAGKAESVATKLSLMNPASHVDPFPADIDESNAALIVDGADVVIDCTNNANARRAIDDACAAAGIGLIGTTVSGYDAEFLAVAPGACLRMLSAPGDSKPGACSVAGTLAAIAAIKRFTRTGEDDRGQLARIDAEAPSVVKEPVSCGGDCPCRSRADAATV